MSLGCPYIIGKFTYPRGHFGQIDKSMKSISSSTEPILDVEESQPDSSFEMKSAVAVS